MSPDHKKLLTDIDVAADPLIAPDVQKLAEGILLLFRITGHNRDNNRDAFGQIEELAKRRGEVEDVDQGEARGASTSSVALPVKVKAAN